LARKVNSYTASADGSPCYDVEASTGLTEGLCSSLIDSPAAAEAAASAAAADCQQQCLQQRLTLVNAATNWHRPRCARMIMNNTYCCCC
jgi:hypothetical protein